MRTAITIIVAMACMCILSYPAVAITPEGAIKAVLDSPKLKQTLREMEEKYSYGTISIATGVGQKKDNRHTVIVILRNDEDASPAMREMQIAFIVDENGRIIREGLDMDGDAVPD